MAYHYPWFASVSTCWALAAAEARGECERERERVKGPLTQKERIYTEGKSGNLAK